MEIVAFSNQKGGVLPNHELPEPCGPGSVKREKKKTPFERIATSRAGNLTKKLRTGESQDHDQYLFLGRPFGNF